ncbi:peptidase [Auriscalpium vulgare]|uniref:Peptidase n=1 Tax=Auriscalpium vulgare TaxID=40419 RepID=A0ACB8RPP3_9AGAM|nr:peptidase [Auriscalpium vulgare]
MKLTYSLVSLATIAAAAALPATLPPLVVQDGNGYSFLPDLKQLPQEVEGFSLDLSAKRLVQLEGMSPVWMTELEKIAAKAKGIKFFDITDTQDLGSFAYLRAPTKGMSAARLACQLALAHFRLRASDFPKPSHSKQVKKVIKELSTAGPKANLQKFSSFRTRYYRSETGRQSQQWLSSKILEITAEYASESIQSLISLTEFPHSWGQNSIVVRINGSNPTDDAVVILGAHQDSTNIWPFLPAPGADDDGSGSVTLLEAYRALITSDFRPVQNVEFHWYSAEEGGLLGSQAVAQAYEKRSVNAIAMSQFDMTAWHKSGTREEVGIITDFVDTAVTELNKQLVDAYLSIPYVETKCGYACSDHASWAKAGYPSSFTIESSFENSNKNIHSGNDRIDISPEFSFDHLLEFSKLAVAFAIELGGWTKSD